MKITEIATPALIIDEEIFDTNLKLMAELCGHKLRPHFKSHKCPEIALKQIAAGAKGMTCATIHEAEVLCANGISDILFANQIADPAKAQRLAVIAGKSKLTVCAEKYEELKLYSDAAVRAGTTINVYAEYNTGMNRMGVNSFEEVLELADMIGNMPNLSFAGVQAYAGQLSHIPDTEERRMGAVALENKMRTLRDMFAAKGITGFEISGGSTGTAAFKIDGGVYTEIQAGSYLCGDNNYGLCGLPYKQSLYVLTTVLGVHGKRVITDAGVKSNSVDQGLPDVDGMTGVTMELHEEHGLLEFADTGAVKFGDRMRYVPGHCCATMNMHDRVYFVRGDEVTGTAEISGRGYGM
nr:alanine racemase [Clostridia bacterium]